MSDMQTWKLITDLLLVGSLIYLCYRFARMPGSGIQAQSPALQAELRALLKEADQAARLLNEKLLKRQTKLEELLFDLETVEGRINRSINTIEESKSDLELRIQKGQKTAQAIADELLKLSRRRPAEPPPIHMEPAEPPPLQVAAPAPAPAAPEPAATAPEIKSEPAVADEMPEPPSFAASKAPPTGRAESRWSSVNIYGEPIAAAAPAPEHRAPKAAPVRKPLAAMVEKEVHHPYSSGNQGENSLQRVYDAAEELLRAGKDLQTVSNITSLPMEEVRMLSRMMAQESRAVGAPPAAETPAADTRLGVLGSMRREIQTL